MALILIIDTCLPTAHVILANENTIIDTATNTNQFEHAKWLHTSIDTLLQKNNIEPKKLTHIAVTNGPGSYTGIRVGLSAAKGLAFALNIPIIPISTLELIARANETGGAEVYIPMIDARRDEVFAAIYDANFEPIETPFAHIVTKDSFNEVIRNKKIIICGDGNTKFQLITGCNQNLLKNTSCNIYFLHKIVISNIIHENFVISNALKANYVKSFFTFSKKD